jgi:arsenite methyltransferase
LDKSLLEILIDPVSKRPLTLEAVESGDEGRVVRGSLRVGLDRQYPIVNGIPRFVVSADADQRQTATSFGFKWEQRDTYESPAVRRVVRDWLVERYGFGRVSEMRRFFAGRRRILDAGCGSGFTTLLWMDDWWKGAAIGEWCGIDISAAIDVARERLGAFPGTHFVQGDILQLPFRREAFDTVYAEGVLHHTPSTEAALKSLVDILGPDGEIIFYVYRRKGPIREFADDYIRTVVSRLEPAEAWAMLRPLTRLGQALGQLRAEVEVPEDIPYLGLKAGRYDVQRLIYWHFAKLYWNDGLSLEENNHVNFDWYHPSYAHRHSEEEVRRWCEEAGLSIIHFNAQESGYSVRAVKG